MFVVWFLVTLTVSCATEEQQKEVTLSESKDSVVSERSKARGECTTGSGIDVVGHAALMGGGWC